MGVIVASLTVGNVLARIALMWWPGLDLPIPELVRFAVALPVVWVGLGFRLWSIRTLGKYFRVVVHVQVDHEVVQTWLYRWLRHPSYSGLLVAVVGSSLLFATSRQSRWSSLAPWSDCATHHCGGRVLCEQLGASYRDYAVRTLAWCPGCGDRGRTTTMRRRCDGPATRATAEAQPVEVRAG